MTVTYFVTPMAAIRRLITDALEAAAPSLEDWAAEAELSSSALRRYRLGDRTPSGVVIAGLAAQLRRQARRLERLAGMLETLSKQKGGRNG